METIEEAAEKYAELNKPDCSFNQSYRSFLAGANWQKEQNDKIREALRQEFEEWHNNLPKGSPIYTEEEVKELINNYHASFATYPTMNLDLRDNWFETNKKK